MDPETLFRDLCRRHGVHPAQAAGVLPILRRALAARGAERERLLGLVAAGLRAHAREALARRRLDDALLVDVARALHGWSPADGLDRLGEPLGPDGPEGE